MELVLVLFLVELIDSAKSGAGAGASAVTAGAGPGAGAGAGSGAGAGGDVIDCSLLGLTTSLDDQGW